MRKNTFVIIDDHSLYRSGISSLVREGLGLECIGEAGSLSEGRQLLDAVEPTLAIVDISLLGESGLTLVSECRTRHPKLKVPPSCLRRSSAFFVASWGSARI